MDAAVIDASATLRGPVAPPVAPPHRIAPHRGQPYCAGIRIREPGVERGDYRLCFDAQTGDSPPGCRIRFTKPTGLTSADPAEFHVRAVTCPWSVSVPGGGVAVVDARTASAAFVYENVSYTRGCRREDQCVCCFIGERALVKRVTSRANSEMKAHPAMGRNDYRTRGELVSSGAAWRTRQSAENQSSMQLLSQEFARRTAAAELAFMIERDRSDKEHAAKLCTAGVGTSLASDLPPDLKDSDANLVVKLMKCLAENKITDQHFMFKLIKAQVESALAPDVRGIRWDPAIVDWATTMYMYGGEAIINLMNGNGGVGVGSGAGGERDVGRTNLAFPSHATIRRNIPKTTAGSGIHGACVLAALDAFESRGFPLVATISIDEMPVTPCLQLNERLGRIQGMVGQDVTYEQVNEGEVDLDTIASTIATTVYVVHLESLLNPCTGPGSEGHVAMSIGYFPATHGMAGTDVWRMTKDAVNVGQRCRRCLERGLPCDPLVSMDDPTCGCCREEGCMCTRLRLEVFAADSAAQNSTVMDWLEEDEEEEEEEEEEEAEAVTEGTLVAPKRGRKESRPDGAWLNKPLPIGDPVHAVKNFFFSAINWYMYLDGDRFGVDAFRQLILRQDDALTYGRAEACGITMENTAPRDKHDFHHMDPMLSNDSARLMLDVGGVVATISGTAGTAGNNDEMEGLKKHQSLQGTIALLNTPLSIAIDLKAGYICVANCGVTESEEFPVTKPPTLARIQVKPKAPLKRLAFMRGLCAVAWSASEGVHFASAVSDDGGCHLHAVSKKGDTAKVQVTFQNSRLPHTFGHVAGISCARDGRLVVTDARTNQVFVLVRDAERSKKGKLFRYVIHMVIGTETAGSGDGDFSVVKFSSPRGVCELFGNTAEEDKIIVADAGNHTVRVIDMKGKQVNLLAGIPGRAGYADGAAGVAMFDTPTGVVISKSGKVYVTDTNNHRVRKVERDETTCAWITDTYAGCGEARVVDGAKAKACFLYPSGIAIDGETIFVADALGHTVRIIMRTDGAMQHWIRMMRYLRYAYTSRRMSDDERLRQAKEASSILGDMEASVLEHTGRSDNGSCGVPGLASRKSVHRNAITMERVLGRFDRGRYRLNPCALGTTALERLFGQAHRLHASTTFSVATFDYVMTDIRWIELQRCTQSGYTMHTGVYRAYDHRTHHAPLRRGHLLTDEETAMFAEEATYGSVVSQISGRGVPSSRPTELRTGLRTARSLVWGDPQASGLIQHPLDRFTAPSTEDSCRAAADVYRSRVKDGIVILTPELTPCEHLNQERRARMHCFIKEAEMKQRSSTSHRATVSINNMGTMPHGVTRRGFHLMEVVKTAAEELSTLLAMPSGGDALRGRSYAPQSLASASFNSIVESLVIDDDECGSVPDAMVEPVLNWYHRLLAVTRSAPRRMNTRRGGTRVHGEGVRGDRRTITNPSMPRPDPIEIDPDAQAQREWSAAVQLQVFGAVSWTCPVGSAKNLLASISDRPKRPLLPPNPYNPSGVYRAEDVPDAPWPLYPLCVQTAAPMGSKKVLNLSLESASLEDMRMEFDEANERGEEPPWRAAVLPRGDGDDGPERTAHWVRLFKDDGEAKPSIQMKARLPSRPFVSDDGSSAANRPRTLAALIAECLGRLQPPHIEDDGERERAREEELAMESYDEGGTWRRQKRQKKVHPVVSVADAQEKRRKVDGDAKKWGTGYVIDQIVDLIKLIKPGADLTKKKKEALVEVALEALGEI